MENPVNNDFNSTPGRFSTLLINYLIIAIILCMILSRAFPALARRAALSLQPLVSAQSLTHYRSSLIFNHNRNTKSSKSRYAAEH